MLLVVLLISAAAQAQLFEHRRKDPNGEGTPSANALPNRQARASQAPAFSIPVEPLGFFAPGAIYQGQRDSLVSLDFLDEDHLLFTFHAPGLIRREGNPNANSERQIRAVLLNLTDGSLEAEALWTLHDRGRYLWMLNDGHFFLRDQNELKVGDNSLELQPFLHFHGPLEWIELDPSQQLIVTESRETADAKLRVGEVQSPGAPSAVFATGDESANGKPDIMLRIIRRTTGQVLLASRTRLTVHLPINADGYVETLRGKGHEWVLNLNYFGSGNKTIGKVDSVCAPSVDFLSTPEILATTCNPDSSRWMVAMSTEGKRLWNASKPSLQIWPRIIPAPNGMRVARETLIVTHEVNTFAPLSFDDVKGQHVEVYNAANGKVELTAEASPVLDGGGNVAISPSAKRVAILDGGGIQVYELPPPSGR